MLQFRTALATTFAMAAFLTMSESGFAQVVPFNSTGVNNLYSPITAEFGGDGITTHLGASAGIGLAIPSPTADPLVFDWVGIGSFVAANGDEIFFSGGGQVFLETADGITFTASWIGEFNIDGGTGRFENVGPGTAPLDVIAINHPFTFADPIWSYDYWITGDIDLGKP